MPASCATALSPAPNNDKYEGFYSAKSLGKFVTEHDGFAGINGTYFCSSASCESYNYYFFPIYDTFLGKIVNEDQLKYWTTGPIMAFDIVNNFYYFKDSRELKSLENFEAVYGTKMQAAIGNKVVARETISARVCGSAVAVSAMRGTCGKRSCSNDNCRYSGRKS